MTKIEPALSADDIARNCDEALASLGGVEITPLNSDGSPVGGTLKVDQDVVDIVLDGDDALREFLGLNPTPEHLEVVGELRERRVSDSQLRGHREKLQNNPPGSQVAMYCRWTPNDGKFRTLLSGIVGPQCKHKTAEEWANSAMSDQRNLDPNHGMPRLTSLGYLDPLTGCFVPQPPGPLIKEAMRRAAAAP